MAMLFGEPGRMLWDSKRHWQSYLWEQQDAVGNILPGLVDIQLGRRPTSRSRDQVGPWTGIQREHLSLGWCDQELEPHLQPKPAAVGGSRCGGKEPIDVESSRETRPRGAAARPAGTGLGVICKSKHAQPNE